MLEGVIIRIITVNTKTVNGVCTSFIETEIISSIVQNKVGCDFKEKFIYLRLYNNLKFYHVLNLIREKLNLPANCLMHYRMIEAPGIVL